MYSFFFFAKRKKDCTSYILLEIERLKKLVRFLAPMHRSNHFATFIKLTCFTWGALQELADRYNMVKGYELDIALRVDLGRRILIVPG